MKIIILYVIFFFISYSSFSQIKFEINGKVICDEFYVKGVDIVNFNNRKSTTTDINGGFSIETKTGDTIVIISTNYNPKKIYIKQTDIENKNLIISLSKKSIILDEVTITKLAPIPVNKNIQSILDKKYIADSQTTPKNPFIYYGTIENGMDLWRIGGDFFKLLRGNEKTIKNDFSKTEFKKIITKKLNQSFFIKNLMLQPEQINLFLEFCEADPISKSFSENSNVLSTMDFLYLKNTEFKGLPQN